MNPEHSSGIDYSNTDDKAPNADVHIAKFSTTFQLPDTSQPPPGLIINTLPPLSSLPTLQTPCSLTPPFPPPAPSYTCPPPTSLPPTSLTTTSLPPTSVPPANLHPTSQIPTTLPPPKQLHSSMAPHTLPATSLPSTRPLSSTSSSIVHPNLLKSERDSTVKASSSQISRRRNHRRWKPHILHGVSAPTQKQSDIETRSQLDNSVTSVSQSSNQQLNAKDPVDIKTNSMKIYKSAEICPPQCRYSVTDSSVHQSSQAPTSVIRWIDFVLLCLCLFAVSLPCDEIAGKAWGGITNAVNIYSIIPWSCCASAVMAWGGITKLSFEWLSNALFCFLKLSFVYAFSDTLVPFGPYCLKVKQVT